MSQFENLTAEDLTRAFSGPVPKIPVTTGYRVRLALVLAGLLLMQFLYIALILLVMAAIFAYVVFSFSLEMRINWVSLVIYLGPPLAGLILLFFLVKPLFARPPKPPEPIRLKPEDEPVLFAFVEQLCRTVGSAKPSAIHLDLGVNASASLKGWRGFFTGELVLTIGIPLVRGLTLPQFTGVLAHEFGHFAQRAGLRSYFLIQTIRHWFARVVYERDSWDYMLEEGGEGEDIRLAAVRGIARLGVKFGRWYLSLLLKAGQWISCGFSRQMEFDADRYETSVVGAGVFEQTSLRMPEIEAGAEAAWQSTNWNLRLGRLPDNVPMLIEKHTEMLARPTLEGIRAQVLEATTKPDDTHPATAERIAQAQRWGSAGCFSLDGPATRLFQNLESASRNVTEHVYRLSLGENFEDRKLTPAAALVEELETEGKYEKAAQQAGLHYPIVFDWFRLPEESSSSAFAAASKEPKRFEFDLKAHDETLGDWWNSASLSAIADVGVQISEDKEALKASLPDKRAAWVNACEELRRQAVPIAQRLRAVADADTLRCLRALESKQEALWELQLVQRKAVFFGRAADHLPSGIGARYIDGAHREASEAMDRVLEAWGGVPCPVVFNPRKSATLADQLGVDENVEYSQRVAQFQTRLEQLWTRLLGRLCWRMENE
jgi:Zn-dependent protease with chaperone function